MILSISQKNIKIKNKMYFIFYIKKNKIIIDKLGYIIFLDKLILVKFNLSKLFYYFLTYKGILAIKNKIYIKFFILFYFISKNIERKNNLKKIYVNSLINKVDLFNKYRIDKRRDILLKITKLIQH
jgi:hypothetical protein